MARIMHITEEEISQACKLRDEAITAAELRKALSVLLMVELGLDAEKTAEVLGTSRRTVFRKREEFRHQDDTSRNSWGGRRRFSLSIEEEREFLSAWEAEATAGGVLSVPPIHAALVKRLGHNTPMSTTYRLLARHGWRKVRPDTKHPKSNRSAQEEFKKNFRSLWLPPA
ncbi:MAG: winged helix-turn-helix domain-containing protein [Bacteroidetes bacterium]|nr:MAG: winged helix-turn-helix domain-containing protein [Bacteroidota bacterium]